MFVAGGPLLSLGCGEGPATPVPETPIPFELERLEGGRVSLSDLSGSLVLLDFWATWCAPCVVEIPELNAFFEEHREAGVEVLAIAVDEEDRSALADWSEKHGIAYPVALGHEDLARQYGAVAFPYHVLLGPDGGVLERLTPGYHDREELRSLVLRHLP